MFDNFLKKRREFIEKIKQLIISIKLKKISAILIIFSFLIPILSAYYLFFYKNIIVRIEYEKTNNKKVLVTILKDKIYYSSFQDVIARVLQTPLSLTHYNVCFSNTSYVEEFSKKEFLKAEEVTISGPNGEDLGIEPFDIEASGRVCKEVNLDRFIINGGSFAYSFKYFPIIASWNINLAPENIAYLSSRDKYISAFVFLIAFYSVFVLIKAIYTEIKNQVKIIFKK